MLLVAVPKSLLASTEYPVPLSARLVAGVVKLLLVAPSIGVPFFFHW